MEKIYPEITQQLAIKGLQSAGPLENIVLSPYAITSQIFSIIPILDNTAKGRISRFFGLREQLKNPREFLRVWEIINLQENNCISMDKCLWTNLIDNEAFSKRGIQVLDTLKYNCPSEFFHLINEVLDPTKQSRISLPIENPDYYKFVSLSSLSINAPWKFQFYEALSNNSKITYHGDQGDIHCLPGLQRSAVYRSHIDSDYKLLDISFADSMAGSSNLSLLLFAPRYRKLRDFELRFTPDFINRAIDKMIDQERAFTMPAFSIDNSYSLLDLFKNDRDLRTVFDTGFLPGLLMHQCSIKVGDGGIAPIPAKFPENTYDGPAELPSSIFFYDSPFTFFVRDRFTGVVFLAGRYVTPDKKTTG
ncbi:MAG: hypothetical protein JEZ00_21280 [Anaerolineaceae bacterium]|nr:hypothetical protein [Anaerolineaceae bacterium]